jgi:hypothetical protein
MKPTTVTRGTDNIFTDLGHIPNKVTRAAMAELERGGSEIYYGSGRKILDAILRETKRHGRQQLNSFHAPTRAKRPK